MMLGLPSDSRGDFPQRPFRVTHELGSCPLFGFDQLREAALALPTEMLEVSVPAFGSTPLAGLMGRSKTLTLLEEIETRPAWVMFRNLERLAPYRALMEELRESLRASCPWVIGGADRFMSFVFVSSPGIVTPLHIDPEHNFLLQISGRKQVSLSDPTERRLPTDEQLRGFFADEVAFELSPSPDWEPHLHKHELNAGEGLFLPSVAPHSVLNGASVSVSFSFTFRSAISDRARDEYRAR